MAVAFDSAASTSATTTGTASLTWTHNVSASATMLLVAVSADALSAAPAAGFYTVTAGGVSMTQVTSSPVNNGGGAGLWVFQLANPPTGASVSIVVTNAGGSNTSSTDALIGGSLSFTGSGSLGTPAVQVSQTSLSFSVTATGVGSSSVVAGFVSAGNTINTPSAGTSRYIQNAKGSAGNTDGNSAGATNTGSGSVPLTWSGQSSADTWCALAIEVSAGAGQIGGPPRPQAAQTSRTWQRRWTRTVRPPIPPQVAQVAPHAGVAAVSAVAVPVPSALYITGTGLAPGGTKAWFTDQHGSPRIFVNEDVWDVIINGGRWNGGNFNADIDAFLGARSAQGYTSVEVQMFSSNNPNAAYVFTDGRDWDGTYPFAGSSTDPSNAPNSAFWAKRDYFFTKAQALGISVVMNATTSALGEAGNWILSWTGTQWSSYGTMLGGRYGSQPNILWIVGDDYFGTIDTSLGSWRSALRTAGGGQLISIQNYQEATSRLDIFSAAKDPNAFDVHAQYEWGYSYNPSYDVVEKAQTYVPSVSDDVQSLVPATWADGFYANSGTATGQTWQRLERQMIWWAMSSGAAGFSTGDNNIFPWGNGSAAQVTGSFYTGVVASVTTFFSTLTGWQLLVADTSSALVTAGRGTHVSAIASGGSGSPYIGNTDSYVTASRAPDGSLALIYCAQAFSITIDQTKMAAGYTAKWLDPANGATTSTTAGSTYNSAAQGNNSAGDPDWVLVLQAPAAVTATAGVAAVAAAAPAATVAETATAGVATVLTVAPAAADAEIVTAGVATVLAAAPAPVPAVTVTAGVAVVLTADPGATVSTSSGTTANAGVATVLAIATAATVAETATAGVAAVLAVAPAPGAAETVTAGVATVLAVAPAASAAETAAAGVAVVSAVSAPPVPAIVVNAGVAVVLAADPGATVNTSGSTNAVAAPAVVLAIAPAPSPAIVVNAGVATVQVLATAATAGSGKVATAGVATVSSLALAAASLTATATAQVARVLAAGVDVPPVFTLGALTATDGPAGTLTASDARTGGPS